MCCSPTKRTSSKVVAATETIDSVLVTDIVERAGVRMVQRGDGARLALEALAEGGITADV